jgi:uncharacterized protein
MSKGQQVMAVAMMHPEPAKTKRKRSGSLEPKGISGARIYSAAVADPFDDAEVAYYRGDYETALRLVRPLAEQGNRAAGGLLGEMYQTGRGVPTDIGQAIKWFTPAAHGGDPRAQTDLGSLNFAVGDFTTAVRWMHDAADQGYAAAQNSLAGFYDLGRGVPQDPVEAAKWYRRAADQAYAPAQDTLGLRYESGLGVPQDYVLSHMWFNLASVNFLALKTMHITVRESQARVARQSRDRVASKMTPAQIAEAQRLGRDWKPK